MTILQVVAPIEVCDPSLDTEACLKDLPSYGPNEDSDCPSCDCKVCRVVVDPRALAAEVK